jgi:ABC-2 type transport system ATP-binding protein
MLKDDGHLLEYRFDIHAEESSIPALLRRLHELGIGFRDLNTEQSSLEDIFVSLTGKRAQAAA